MVKSANSLSLLIKKKMFKRVYAEAPESLLFSVISSSRILHTANCSLLSTTEPAILLTWHGFTATNRSAATTALSALSLVWPRLSLLLSQPDTLWHGGAFPERLLGNLFCQSVSCIKTSAKSRVSTLWRIRPKPSAGGSPGSGSPMLLYTQGSQDSLPESRIKCCTYLIRFKAHWSGMCFFTALKRWIQGSTLHYLAAVWHWISLV